MKNDKVRIAAMIIVTILLLATILLYGAQIIKLGKVNLGSSIAFVIPLILIVFMVFFIKRRYQDIKQGMPMEDERSRKVMTKSAAMAFYVSLYWLLFISFFESSFARMFGAEHLDASQTTGGGIAGMAIFFLIFWIYYDRKGKLI